MFGSLFSSYSIRNLCRRVAGFLTSYHLPLSRNRLLTGFESQQLRLLALPETTTEMPLS